MGDTNTGAGSLTCPHCGETFDVTTHPAKDKPTAPQNAPAPPPPPRRPQLGPPGVPRGYPVQPKPAPKLGGSGRKF